MVNSFLGDGFLAHTVIMPMYDLIEYSDNYSKTSGSLWEYYWDEPVLNNNGAVIDFPADNNNSALFKFKTKITDRKGNDGIKDVLKMAL